MENLKGQNFQLQVAIQFEKKLCYCEHSMKETQNFDARFELGFDGF